MSARSERGFALLIVLWSLVLLAFLMMQILASGRTALDLAGNLRAQAQEAAVADGALNEAMFHLAATGAAHWPPGGGYSVRVGTETAKIQLQNLGGRVNPNVASPALLDSLLQAAGVAPAQADGLASAIVAWRSPPESADAAAASLAPYRRAGLAFGPAGHGFLDLNELRNVIGMTPGIFAALAPHLSLFQPGEPDPEVADPMVRKALAQAGSMGLAGSAYANPPVVAVRACTAPAFCRQAVVSFARANGAMPFEILALGADH